MWIHPINQGADRNRDDDEYEHKDPDKSAFVLSKLTPDVGPHRPVFGFDYSGIHRSRGRIHLVVRRSVIANTRVQHAVQHICDEIKEHYQNGKKECQRLYRWNIRSFDCDD